MFGIDVFLVFTLAFSALIISYAYWKRKIELTAALASATVGLVALLTVGTYWLYLILAFFVFGNLVTKYQYDVKREKGVAEKERTFHNVFGNGGAALVFGLFYRATGHPVFLFGFLGAMASAAADTFATEIGVLYDAKPRMITNLKKAETGSNGAISVPGTFAAVLGAALISVVPLFFQTPGMNKDLLFVIGTVAGLMGSVVDSFIGATLEGKMKIMDNHMTNFLGTLAGGFCAMLLFRIFA